MTEESIRADERKAILDKIKKEFYCHDCYGGTCRVNIAECRECPDYTASFLDISNAILQE